MNKLGGIYSALDSGNNKQALKLCNALLTKKKDENTNAVKILKAITLAKLGENEEAIKCADEIAFIGHTNETLLSNLNYFYKSVHQADKMTKVYEASFKVNPNNENLAEGLFLAYAKVRDFDLQKHMALHLKKTFPTTQHSLWFLMTYLSMAQSTDTPSKKLYIDVCQKAIEGLIGEGKITTSEQLFMYETVLDIQGKTEEHLELIKGKMGELYNVATERLKILGDLFQKLGRHQEAANSFSEILTKYEPDEWSCYMGYFDNIWALNDISKIDDAKQFVQNIQQQQEQQTKHSLRGPYLAEIEICFRLLTQQKDAASMDGPVFDKLVDKMLGYFKKFGSKPVLYQDLKKYIHFVETKKSVEQRKEILQKVRELVVTDKDNTVYISQISNYYKLERALGLQSELTLEQVKKTIDEIIQDYQYNTKKYPLAIESERYPGDDLILICYFLLLDQYQSSKQVSLLIESAAILEFASSISTRNYQFNLYLLSLYFELGAHQLAHNHFKILNIKNIQWDTLGHLVMDQYVREPISFTNTITSFEKSCKFYNENDSTPDYVAASYSNGCYSKILEIQKFQVKVANSFQKSVYETERQLFNFMLVRLKNLQSTPATTPAQLIQMCKAQIASTDPLNFDCSQEVMSAFSFNQDKTIYDSFNPSTFKPIAKEIQGITSLYLDSDNYDQSNLLLMLTHRRQILNILFSISNGTPIDQLLIDFEKTLSQLKSTIISHPIDSIVNTITLNQFKLLNLTLNLLKNYEESKFNEIKELFDIINKDIQEIVTILISSIRESEFVGTSLNNVSKSVRMVVSSFVEPFTWLSFVSLLINTALPGKRAKKKEEYHIQIRSHLESTAKLLSDHSIELTNVINEKSLSKLSINGDELSTKLGLTDDNSLIKKSTIVNSISDNSNQSFNELKQYLNSLKLLLNFSVNNTNNVA